MELTEALEQKIEESIYELIVKTSTELPLDVTDAIQSAKAKEFANTESICSIIALDIINSNIEQAANTSLPICQDTGMPTFKIKTPINFNQLKLRPLIEKAIIKATNNGQLRTNSVDSLTGINSGNNLGPGTPVIYMEQWEQNYLEIKLILKGGGCENKNIQYSLPCELEGLGRASRDLDGIRKCILHSVYQAQGQGCSAGIIGVSIGGDRASGYAHAKEQLFRALNDKNPVSELAQLEEYIMKKANTLGIGTMGFGGETTLLGCKIGVQNRLPASFFVSVAYNCWAYRRQGVLINSQSGCIKKWLYQLNNIENNKNNIKEKIIKPNISGNYREFHLKTSITEEQIRNLKIGDIVYLSGIIYTGRDAIHKHLYDKEIAPVNLQGQVIYHCGPVMLKDQDNNWQVKGAGPTTSIREEPYQADIIKRYGIRAIIGKGGMGAKTLAGLKEYGAVYLNAIGGAAQYYSHCIKNINNVYLLEYGIPEAMWELEVENFPVIVTMDSHGNSLHNDIDYSSLERLTQLKDDHINY